MRNFSFERLDYSSIKSVTTQKKCENYCQQGDAAGWKAQIFQKKCHILSFSTLTLQRAYTAIKPEFDCHFEEFWFREVLVCFSCCVFANKWNDTSQLNFGFFSQFSLFTARPRDRVWPGQRNLSHKSFFLYLIFKTKFSKRIGLCKFSWEFYHFISWHELDIGILFTTHILQPWDVALFKPLKECCKSRVNEWTMQDPSNKVTQQIMAGLLHDVWQNLPLKYGQNGFRACRLYPWNPKAVR